MQKEKLYIIPGYHESPKNLGYKQLIKSGKEKGYDVVFWEPEWKYKKMSDWVSDFSKKVGSSHQNTTVIGFSFGAFIALLASEKTKIDKIISCSLSPYFEDDINKLPDLAFKILGKRRMLEFKSTRLPKQISAKPDRLPQNRLLQRQRGPGQAQLPKTGGARVDHPRR